jgi:competence protein ComEC
VNLLIVPVQPLILVVGTVGVLGGLAGLIWLAQPLLWVAWLGLNWTVQLVNWAAYLPGMNVQVRGYGVGALFLTYALIALAYAAVARKEKIDLATLHPKRITSPAGLGTLALIASLVWAAVFTLPDGRLHLYFLDIGQGDGILIQTPSGRQVLIDGGASQERLLTQLGEVMPWWDRSIDMVLTTHPDRDHMGAQMIVPERYSIEYALDTPAMQQDEDAAEWRDAVIEGGAEVAIQHIGGWVDLGDGVALWVLWPPETPVTGDNASNENSLVMKLVYGDFSVLLTGDAGIPSESTWLAKEMPLDARVLKVGHHGSAHSTSTGLVEAVDPEWAVIQVGATNTYGHPTQEVLDVLAGRTIYRNDLDGRIHFATDGSEVWVETER